MTARGGTIPDTFAWCRQGALRDVLPPPPLAPARRRRVKQADIGEDFRHVSLQQHNDRHSEPLHRVDQLVGGLPRRRDHDQIGTLSRHRVNRKAEPAADQGLPTISGG